MIEESKKYNKSFWKSVANNPEYKWLIDEVKKIYTQATEQPLPMLTYSLRMTYYQKGDRSEFATPFLNRRKRMYSSALLALLYPEEEEYLIQLQDSVWAICDEFCWASPYHVKNKIEEQDKTIDLAAATTAYALSEIYLLFQDRLDDIVAKRIKRKIKDDIIDVFLKYEQHWEQANNNWLTVTSCGVGASFIRLFPEQYPEAEQRLLRAMNRYIDCFPEDGACLEGGGYWNFGFGHFLWLAEMIYDFTDGKTDFLCSEKVKKIAAFGQKLFLKGNTNISFADSSRSIVPQIAISYYLAKKFPGSNKIVVNKNGLTFGEQWCGMINAFVYYDPQLEVHETVNGTYYFPDAAWYITTKERYSFAAKAGNNEEPHNHNDIGTFILSTEHGQEIADVGHGKYIKDYFDKNNRYNIFCNSARSHCVPVINGVQQKQGELYRGEMKAEKDAVTIDMKNAYDLPELKKFMRTFKIEQDGIILNDCWDINFETFTERFISPFKPVVQDGKILLRNVMIHYDELMADVQVSEQDHRCHFGEKSEKVYCIDFELKKGINEFCLKFETQG